ncbi:hypothetical protein AVEN_179039-1 [Araneus ventricosus]|uniref:Uncharacterized protein n=1 Tax=Araneus ventricosus TaxID=182803 RepID=A0A4Y2J8X5_ARAVE|nr:hypothetical protein AVEN_179039-1 [Araneus ventricosus]
MRLRDNLQIITPIGQVYAPTWYKFFGNFREEGRKLMMKALFHSITRLLIASGGGFRAFFNGPTRGNCKVIDPDCKTGSVQVEGGQPHFVGYGYSNWAHHLTQCFV